MAELSDMKPKSLLVGSLAVAALVLLLLLLGQLPTARPLDAAGPVTLIFSQVGDSHALVKVSIRTLAMWTTVHYDPRWPTG